MLAPGQAQGLERRAGKGNLEPFQKAGHIGFAIAVVSGSLKQVEDHVGPLPAEACEEHIRVMAGTEAAHLKACLGETVGYHFNRVKDFFFRLGIGVVGWENGFVMKDEDLWR